MTKQNLYAILAAGLWVNASEFFRNEVLLKSYWTGHYTSLGLVFPSAPVNGMMWMVWGFLYSVSIHMISRKFDLLRTGAISWFMGFVLMWVVTWNLSVLPLPILVYAVPLSIVEAFGASYLCTKIDPIS
ncbi:MAG: hypothetical protein ACOYNS_07945 [Bacteroidota bacterium]